MKTRFVDTGRRLDMFAGEFVVCCPRCGSAGMVRRAWDGERRRWERARFSCLACGRFRYEGRWAGPLSLAVQRRCGNCGRWLTFERTVSTAPTSLKVELTCHDCQATTVTQAHVWAIGTPRALVDDCFGLPLWLQTSCAGHTLWAYNAEHVAYLKDFVRAGLRERQGFVNTSLASRLPVWLKQAKHRAEALRAIGRLETLIP
ncbi:hypothetical protein [Paractinoplanes lichenicola]|uniref:Uncharacterized protein n=1 Tax=Paractinoplanes lichenicola TaxID=2802976 RepID=A0ABS1VL27_9ACTN|nr:hypothetical protein [Actinoplanes lichenicola]MBL7255416.1 hypothetical protein [Actinoplanes lichenicola]